MKHSKTLLPLILLSGIHSPLLFAENKRVENLQTTGVNKENMRKEVSQNESRHEMPTQSSTAKDAEALAIDTLAQRIGENKNQIETLSVEAINWPDASIGCPQEGLMYPQVIIPGYRVTLKAGIKTYSIHTAKKRAVICDKPGKQTLQAPTKKLGPLTKEILSNIAKTDLAYKLRVEKNQVQIKKINEVTWTDASLGCPQGKKDYKKESIPGYVFHLNVNGKNYTYHSDQTTKVFACPAIATM
ncbi:hypothetical protein TDB9533_04324 [Thalassocella blandensis]|nr:hypothetical protein TDB9533_04324 [Thalassocella blandensis]